MPLFRGSGGAIFEVTPPDPGTAARENFDAALERGDLVLIEEAPVEEAPVEEAPVEEAPTPRRTRPKPAPKD